MLALLAVVSSAIPFEHLVIHGHALSDHQVHELHCHQTPADCSDAPVSSGPGQFLLGDPLLTTPALLAVLVVAVSPPMLGLATRPTLRPPVA